MTRWRRSQWHTTGEQNPSFLTGWAEMVEPSTDTGRTHKARTKSGAVIKEPR